MEETFVAFSKFGDTKSTGKELDNKKFSKLCKETGIMVKLVTSTDVDIIFSKYKPLVVKLPIFYKIFTFKQRFSISLKFLQERWKDNYS